jgi:pimeloyl-ACP methyl ester carboxylesterase
LKRLGRILKILILSTVVLVILTVLLFGHGDIPLDELKAKYAQEPSEFMALDGMNVHYRDEGKSPDSIPIVLIHGTGSSLHTFDDWEDALKKDYRVIRMDLPGYGLTGPFPEPDYSIDAYVDFIKDFLDKRGVDQCIIGGNSLGGHIAWRFTLEYPQEVTQLILIDAAGYPNKSKSEPIAFRVAKTPVIRNALTFITPKSIARASIENVYADKTKVTDELVNRYFELTLRAGNRQAFIDRFSSLKDPSAFRRIHSIEQPTLILWGAQDELIPPENAERFHNDLPNDTLVILENAGHVPMEESPEQSLDALKAFLNSND